MKRKKKMLRVEIDGVLYVPASEAHSARFVPPDAAVSRMVASKLVEMLWIYPGYYTGSRGPVGLIHDILKEIAPDVQTRLAEVNAEDVIHEFFPEMIEEPNP